MIKSFSTASFVIGVMVGALIAGGYFLAENDSLDISQPPSRSSNTDSFLSESSVISVNTQPAGDTVYIGSVTVPLPGVWIAVRETNDGALGNVLGATRVGGTRTSISVPLLRATEPGRSYAVELYRDDNDGVFDVGFNSVYIDFDTGKPVIIHFKTAE